MRPVTKTLTLAAVALLALTACTDESSQAKEGQARQSSFDALVAGQPAKPMTYSPTRETVNHWAEKWSEPGKLSYTYFLNADGEAWGYYILEGLPVSYCAMLTPTYEFRSSGGSRFQVPAPGIDGAYYSGGQCNTYYGVDATTGSLVEWTTGLGTSTVTYEEPQGFPGARALGPTAEDDVEGDDK